MTELVQKIINEAENSAHIVLSKIDSEDLTSKFEVVVLTLFFLACLLGITPIF